ncbi:MAG: hypothetical protein N4J56_007007 [Chroococcidiopsis sp. SAG 2025]|uniref:50S ribosomal protein L11 methyltransferase n=1 Tax=Chroococcidiopsis sp. SAG 2025 TaxID=171389 RepID=UPI000D067643|nr:50S ribosomal protein L11 methyltransferase [Chroococcidiopsis sp. SAG 2025]MDV2997302.1 hypothetical protein [Chroococcidiopsis sp. SAG 2025]PSB49162.1 hypothetical protein C7B80_02905 [Cyanosarcina cf. burmensis CCALA 770]
MKFDFNSANYYGIEDVWLPLSEGILDWNKDSHQLMLNDELRMNSFKRAIQEVIQPGMIVIDVGTGTGILGLWALEAGAKHLYAIEMNSEILPVVVRNFEREFPGKYEVFNKISYNLELPTRGDVIISEILGNLGDNEDCVPILTDARHRFLREGGIMLPSKVCSKLVPIDSLKVHQQVQSRNVKSISGYTIETLLQRLAITNQFDLYYDAILPNTSHLSTPQVAKEFRFDGSDRDTYEISLIFTVEVDGIFTGLKGSFVAQLSDSVILDISKSDDFSSVRWKHAYLPIETPIEVKRGDKICLAFSRFCSSGGLPFAQVYKESVRTEISLFLIENSTSHLFLKT